MNINTTDLSKTTKLNLLTCKKDLCHLPGGIGRLVPSCKVDLTYKK